ncbi:hypothetical protein KM176_05520 [Pseudooceanicola sp. CBS1P-1]|uniref:DUF1376 domain-containing protein n=1 Tax=Pseudooceanicola albus TaxID=2692189 RepID=A0A6L7FYH2_9RHOB|nr:MULTISPECIES: hypothetical protein [Pseudooceanicola]MBT9383311.1 hypothetical protein [Pseudooceanicola endophyticus]MXN16366.1 hypothetical protein [Pseudooceanicola albus]
MTDFERQPDMWPLKRGETLSNHDWFPLYGHRFLGSSFVRKAVLQGRRADIGTAMILWAEAMREDPAGTLPTDDEELASLARFQSVEDWLEVREGVLHGWEFVFVEDERTGETQRRLGHPGFMQGVVLQMHKRKISRDAGREMRNLAVKKSRIKKKMEELQVREPLLSDSRALHAMAEFFEQSDLHITHDNVRSAMVEVLGYSGDVMPFPTAGRRPAGR